MSLIVPLLIRQVLQIFSSTTNSFKDSKTVNIVLPYFIVILFLHLLVYICNYFTTYYGGMLGARIEGDMRSDLFLHYQQLSMSFYDDQRIGSLMSRMTTDLNNISELLHRGPESITVFFFRFIGAAVILFFVNWVLATMVMVMTFSMLLYVFHMMPIMHRAFKQNHKELAKVNHRIQESLAGIKIIKSFANEDIEIKKFDKVNRDVILSRKQTYIIMSKFFPAFNTFLLGITPITVIFAFVLVLSNVMTSSLEADIMTFMLYIDLFRQPIVTLLALVIQFQDGSAGYNRFLEILDIKSEIKNKKNAIKLNDVKGHVVFDNVSFKYKDHEDYVFNNLNLEIMPGEYVALVGPSGVGKSTLCSLIPRLYEVYGGQIKIDDINIKDIDIKSLREHIGFVHQDTYLFAESIYDNIKYGNEDATQQEIINAAKKAYAHDFISNLPDGYDTDAGQSGVKLSGGQKQRISIARVFLRNPEILIFDEATSSLDNESEKYIQKSLEELAKNRTTIVIAHRLSTIKNAKRIIVLEKDGIVEQGTHQKLIAKRGIYYDLYSLMQ
jgi:ATP-binding cassette subfamily B protein